MKFDSFVLGGDYHRQELILHFAFMEEAVPPEYSDTQKAPVAKLRHPVCRSHRVHGVTSELTSLSTFKIRVTTNTFQLTRTRVCASVRRHRVWRADGGWMSAAWERQCFADADNAYGKETSDGMFA
jgi:hypothetical protein